MAMWMVVALLLAYGICHAAGQALLFAPLVGTAVIAFGTPDAAMARWRAALGGHLISATLALLCLRWCPPGTLGVAMIACSVFVFLAMMYSDTLHSPAGATPIALVALRDVADPVLVLGCTLAALLTILMVARVARRCAQRP
jgi:CBS-domain-containing membrane protein